jgi:glycosyltransferase involved in cell wall biosynthesis
MKIIYYSPHPHINMAAPSGPGTHIREVVHALRAAGCEVVTLIGGGEELAAQSASIAYKKRSWKKWVPDILWQTLKDFQLRRFDQSMAIRLEQYIDKHQPDFIYERAAYLMDSGSRVSNARNIPHFLEVNAPYPEEKVKMEGRSLFLSKAKQIEAEITSKASAVFTVSTAMREYLQRRIGKTSDHIHVVPNAVGEDWLSFVSKQKEELRIKYQLPADGLVVGFVGSIFPYHGVDRMIQAAAHFARSQNNSLRMLVVGDGEIVPQLKLMAKDLNVDNQVIFTGNVPHAQVKEYINLMDVCVMPRSNWYGSPVKIFEYGAMGKCIVGPDVIPVRDVMEDQLDGLLIADTDGGLIEAIDHVIKHPEKAKGMAERFQNRVRTQFTWSNVAQTILKCKR